MLRNWEIVDIIRIICASPLLFMLFFVRQLLLLYHHILYMVFGSTHIKLIIVNHIFYIFTYYIVGSEPKGVISKYQIVQESHFKQFST